MRATAELRQGFSPGVRFLIQRRLNRSDVGPEAKSVLDAAIDAVRADGSLRAENLPGLVRKLIHERFLTPAGPMESPIAGSHATASRSAEVVLGGLSAVERDALRRCYVLGEPPESFLEGLKLTLEEFRALRSKARAEFHARQAKQTKEVNVA
jgi:hypothetical protein